MGHVEKLLLVLYSLKCGGFKLLKCNVMCVFLKY